MYAHTDTLTQLSSGLHVVGLGWVWCGASWISSSYHTTARSNRADEPCLSPVAYKGNSVRGITPDLGLLFI